MFDIILESMQRDAAEKTQSAALSLKYHRAIAIVHHLFTLLAGFIAYLSLLSGFLLAENFPKHGTKIIIAVSGFSASLLVVTTILKRNGLFLSIMSGIVTRVASKIGRARQCNPFFAHFFSILLLIYLPLCVLVIVVILSKGPWLVVSLSSSQMFIDSVRQIITFTAIILPVQVALFTFMFAQLLGRYSSGIVGILYSAPAILLLWLHPIISLVLLNFACLYGFPENLKGVLPFFFVSLNVICLVITIWVANTGTQADKVVAYAGNRFGEKIRRKTKRALPDSAGGNWLWVLLNYLGLNWRDPKRMILFAPPAKAVAITNPLLATLFNVANRAVVDGQQEVFVSALFGIKRVLGAYIEKRASYFGTTDPVISYTIDQMSSLLSASSKASNEYLITEVVRCIGDGTILSLFIEVMPRRKDPSIDEKMSRGNHPLTSLWMGLIGEAFELSHLLMRSTAANEAINQLARIALFAFGREYGEVVFVGYLPKIKEIHGMCISRPDAYHFTLAGDCIGRTMGLWSVVTGKYGQWASRENLNEEIANAIFTMAMKQFAVEKLPSFNFRDPTTLLTSKIERGRPIIQDIFFITVLRKYSESWEQRECVNDLKRLIMLVVNLAKGAVSQKIALPDNYVEALYEISYMVLRGLPEQYKKTLTRGGEDTEFEKPLPSPEEVLENAIFDAWSQLFPVYFKADSHLGLDWKQGFFGIVGIGMLRYADQKRDSLKTAMKKLIQEYLDLCSKENEDREHGIWDWAWDYLQLVGAWTFHFLGEEDLARVIAKTVAQGRPFHYSTMGFLVSSHSRYGALGYPEGSLHSAFFLPWLRNLQPQEYLTEQEWDTFRQWQKRLMDEEVLIPFYNIVEETRKPLRGDFYKKMHEYEEKKKKK